MFKPNYFLKIRRVGGRGPRRQWGWEWDSVVTNGRVRVPRATGPTGDGSGGRDPKPIPLPVLTLHPSDPSDPSQNLNGRVRAGDGQGSDGRVKGPTGFVITLHNNNT